MPNVIAGLRQWAWTVLAFSGSALLSKSREVVMGAVLGALLGFFWEDVDAWVRSAVQPGNLGGTYVIKSFSYDTATKQVATVHTVRLKHGGNRVFGAMASESGKSWYLNGYVRNKFMSLAYGGAEEDGLGTGTYSFQRDVADILWGYVTQVECIGLEGMYTRCPALMYRTGRADREQDYKDFMARSCEKVLIQAPDKCQDLKANTILTQ
jgi:hypothetical protein